jgi:hypothetical protein
MGPNRPRSMTAVGSPSPVPICTRKRLQPPGHQSDYPAACWGHLIRPVIAAIPKGTISQPKRLRTRSKSRRPRRLSNGRHSSRACKSITGAKTSRLYHKPSGNHRNFLGGEAKCRSCMVSVLNRAEAPTTINTLRISVQYVCRPYPTSNRLAQLHACSHIARDGRSRSWCAIYAASD